MGITQQLDQCHSLGMNANYPQYMNNIQPSHNLLFQSSSINPFQSTRCMLIYTGVYRRELRVHMFLDPDPTKTKFLDPGPDPDPDGFRPESFFTNIWHFLSTKLNK